MAERSVGPWLTEMMPKTVSCVAVHVAVQSLMPLSLQAELVLSDMVATVSHNLFNQCSVILRMLMQQCGQNAYGTRKWQHLCKVLQ